MRGWWWVVPQFGNLRADPLVVVELELDHQLVPRFSTPETFSKGPVKEEDYDFGV